MGAISALDATFIEAQPFRHWLWPLPAIQSGAFEQFSYLYLATLKEKTRRRIAQYPRSIPL